MKTIVYYCICEKEKEWKSNDLLSIIQPTPLQHDSVIVAIVLRWTLDQLMPVMEENQMQRIASSAHLFNRHYSRSELSSVECYLLRFFIVVDRPLQPIFQVREIWEDGYEVLKLEN